MIVGDFKTQKRTQRSGKVVVDKIVTSTTGVEYAIGPKFGAGGVASVFRARRLKDKKECVFKEYVPSQERQKTHIAIRRNIENLIKDPLTERDGKLLRSFVGPMDGDSLINLPRSNGFGYMMDLVDTEHYLPIPKLWHKETYPDDEILRKACINIAKFFDIVHFKGWCYKDINEGNIYINNSTGDVKIIDCDNISTQNSKTIKGTDGFMAPEVYVSGEPNKFTDYFSMAVLFYRLFVGGWPMDGKKTRNYLMKTNLSVQEASPKIYGTEALFAFDYKDDSNSIRGLFDPKNPQLYDIQTSRWDRLPLEIQTGFMKTFSDGLEERNKNLRTTDRDWIRIFEDLKNKMVRCSCRKVNFGNYSQNAKCFFCKATLPKLQSQQQPSKVSKTGNQRLASSQNPGVIKPVVLNPTPIVEPRSVIFKVLRDIHPFNLSFVAERKKTSPGADIYPGFKDGWLKLEYNKNKNLIAANNNSTYTWSVLYNGSRSICNPGERVILRTGLIITVLKRQLQLTVVGIK